MISPVQIISLRHSAKIPLHRFGVNRRFQQLVSLPLSAVETFAHALAMPCYRAKMNPLTLVYYITAHGFGHGVRSCDILRAFHNAYPQVSLTLVTDLPEAFLRNRLLGVPFALRRAVFDVGMFQLDSVRVDVGKTLRAAQDVMDSRPALISQEVAFLKEHNAGLVVCDIPAIPLEAAAQLELPRLAIGNFSWDWIYTDFLSRNPAWQPIIEAFEDGYRQADVLLRLPFADAMKVFPRQVDMPVLADPGTDRREELAKLTGAPLDRAWVLLSFSSLDWDAAALQRVEQLADEYAFFTVLPLGWSGSNLYAIDRDDMRFQDVLASVDYVITKPGFGIVSECVVNRKPMIYVDREDFAEYAVLEKAIQRYVRSCHIPARELYRGELASFLAAIAAQPEPSDSPALGGAAVVSRYLAGHLGVREHQ